MDKELAIEGFFKSLKLSLKSASIYPNEHPALKKSVREVKEKIDTLLNFLSPLKIGFTTHSLLVDGKYFEKERIHEELARIFHFHRIKMIEIKEGLTAEELMAFITKVYLAPEEILRKGGFSHILKEEKISHLAVEELDYSQLLKGEGEEIKDIWPYLLEEAVSQEDSQKINELADNFEKVVGHFKIEDLLENENFMKNIDRFLTQLKNIEKDKFNNCSKELLKSIVKNKNVTQETQLEKSRMFFKDLSNEDIASTLLEEILTDDDFNSLSFQIFCELSARGRQKKIADSFANQFRKESILHRSPKVRKKIKDLMTGSSGSIISEIYRQTLSSLLKEMSSEGEMIFDRNHLQKNYHFILLNLLDEEKRKKRMVSILEKILGEWKSITLEKNMDFLKTLIKVLDRRRGELFSEPIFTETNTKIINFIVDKAALKKGASSDLEDFITYLNRSFISSKAYLDKIFKEDKVNPQILRYFFQLYPDSLPLFYKNLRGKSSDTKSLKKLIKSLEKVDSPQSKETLKYILSIGDESIKIEVLKALPKPSAQDENYFFDILEKGSDSLKKEGLKILVRKKSTREKALEKLFSIPSPFGTKNEVLLKNIKIVQEVDLTEARDNLIALSKKKFFWNKKLKGEALRVLEEWDARKN